MNDHPITTEQLDELRRLEQEATPGPWTAVECEDEAAGVCFWLLRFRLGGRWSDFMDKPDADFIAAARSAIPELIAEVERLRGLIRDGYFEGAAAGWLSSTPNVSDIVTWWDDSDVKQKMEARSDD